MWFFAPPIDGFAGLTADVLAGFARLLFTVVLPAAAPELPAPDELGLHSLWYLTPLIDTPAPVIFLPHAAQSGEKSWAWHSAQRGTPFSALKGTPTRGFVHSAHWKHALWWRAAD